MRKLSIFALLLFASCEVHFEPRLCYYQMTFSDGLPVQFWLTDCETYNEKEVDGINRACWCQPWQCDDEINIQFQDDSSPDADFSLLAKSSDGEYLSITPFTNLGNNTYYTSLIPEDESICDEVIALEIAQDDNTFLLLEPDEWNDVGSIPFGSVTDTTFVNASTNGSDNKRAEMPLIVPVGVVVIIRYTVEVTGTWTESGNPIFVSFTLRDGVGNNVSTGLLSVAEKMISANGTYQYVERLTTTDASSVLRLDLIDNITSGTANITITVTPGTVLYAEPSAKSDCLHIKTAHSGTKLIEYSNNRNYAGLIYEDVSPVQNFYLRVPAVFFHTRLPQESRAIERTTSTVITSSKLKRQKLLQVEHVPEYFHDKIVIALTHHNVEIDGKQWKKEEAYEQDEGDPRYPLKKATCYLTEKNFLARNTL